jgi:hypothetical protein
LGGEHTPIGADGTVDISPSARFCIKEAEIITALYKVRKLSIKRIYISFVSFFLIYAKTSSFCQDRLGTSTGKALTKREIMRFSRRALNSSSLRRTLRRRQVIRATSCRGG